MTGRSQSVLSALAWSITKCLSFRIQCLLKELCAPTQHSQIQSDLVGSWAYSTWALESFCLRSSLAGHGGFPWSPRWGQGKLSCPAWLLAVYSPASFASIPWGHCLTEVLLCRAQVSASTLSFCFPFPVTEKKDSGKKRKSRRGIGYRLQRPGPGRWRLC